VAGAKPKAPGGPVIPYLGTTLPPISIMIRYFGPLSSVADETWINFCGHRLQINRVIAGVAQAAGNDLAAAGFTGYIRSVGGFRTTVGASGSPIPFSMHQFGAALDINEDGGPDGNWQTMTLPPLMVSIMARHHFFCGQSWTGGSRDGGHFQYTGGTAASGIAAAGGAGGAGGGGAGPSSGAIAGAVTGLALVGTAIAAMFLAATGLGIIGALAITGAVAALGIGARQRAARR